MEQINNVIRSPVIDYQVLKAEDRLDFNDHSFDLEIFYHEVMRLLKPEGIFATWTYGFQGPIQKDIDILLHEFYFGTLGPFWKQNNQLIWNEYCDLPFPFEEILTPKIRLEVEWSLDELMGYFRSWSATQLYRDQNQMDPTLSLREKLLQHWKNPESKKCLHWKLIFRAGMKKNGDSLIP